MSTVNMYDDVMSHPADLHRKNHHSDGEKHGGGAGNRLRHRHPAGKKKQ